MDFILERENQHNKTLMWNKLDLTRIVGISIMDSIISRGVSSRIVGISIMDSIISRGVSSRIVGISR